MTVDGYSYLQDNPAPNRAAAGRATVTAARSGAR